MKCFSLVANNYLVGPGLAGMHTAGAHYVIDSYPKPKPGFDLEPTERVLRVGFAERVPASEELLRLSPEGGAVSRDGTRVTVLRASVRKDNGRAVLVPEEKGDERNALVYINVGSGRHSFVRIPSNIEQLVTHSRSDGENGADKALVVLKPFGEPVRIVRSDLKWIFWGEERVKEILTIRFDGENVFYDIQRVNHG